VASSTRLFIDTPLRVLEYVSLPVSPFVCLSICVCLSQNKWERKWMKWSCRCRRASTVQPRAPACFFLCAPIYSTAGRQHCNGGRKRISSFHRVSERTLPQLSLLSSAGWKMSSSLRVTGWRLIERWYACYSYRPWVQLLFVDAGNDGRIIISLRYH